MITHYLNHEIIVAVDFARSWVLVGETSGPRGTGCVTRHYRLRRVDGRWRKDTPVPRQQVQCPGLDAEEHVWREGANPPVAVRVHFDRRPVIVARKQLAGALTGVAKLTSKSLGDDGLLTLHTHARGLSLTSHGAASLRFDDDLDQPAAGDLQVDDYSDGLGTVVVCAAALAAALKHSDRAVVSIEVEPRAACRRVQVSGQRLWTVDAKPVSTARGVCSASPLGAALARALPFIHSGEPPRPNLNRARIRGRGDHVIVTATDGHRLYEERVGDLPAPVEGEYAVPHGVLKALHSRRHEYRVGFDSSDVIIESDGLAVRCVSGGPTFPPTDQILQPLQRLVESGCGFALPRAMSDAIRTWLNSAALSKVDIIQAQFADGMIGVRFDYGAAKPAVFGTLTGSGHFEPLAIGKHTRSSTIWTSLYYLDRAYLADAFEVFDNGAAIQVALTSDSCEPLYLTDGKRSTIVMPRRG